MIPSIGPMILKEPADCIAEFHLDEKKQDSILHFSVKEPSGLRTYIYDMDEKYVIVLEPLRKISAYYLLTAYYLIGKDAKIKSHAFSEPDGHCK